MGKIHRHIHTHTHLQNTLCSADADAAAANEASRVDREQMPRAFALKVRKRLTMSTTPTTMSPKSVAHSAQAAAQRERESVYAQAKRESKAARRLCESEPDETTQANETNFNERVNAQQREPKAMEECTGKQAERSQRLQAQANETNVNETAQSKAERVSAEAQQSPRLQVQTNEHH